MNAAKKIKTAMSLDSEVVAQMQQLADRNHGGNLSQAINSALLNELHLSNGPYSKIFQFSSEIAGILRKLGLRITHLEHAADWILPELSLGIESKTRFTPGKAENATVAAMAYTIGQSLCSEIWIVGCDAMPKADQHAWEIVARDFHLCPTRFILASLLEHELRARKVHCSAKTTR